MEKTAGFHTVFVYPVSLFSGDSEFFLLLVLVLVLILVLFVFSTGGWKEVAEGSLYMEWKMVYTVCNGTGILLKENDYE